MDTFWYVVAGLGFVVVVMGMLTVSVIAKARIDAQKEYQLARFSYMGQEGNRR